MSFYELYKDPVLDFERGWESDALHCRERQCKKGPTAQKDSVLDRACIKRAVFVFVFVLVLVCPQKKSRA